MHVRTRSYSRGSIYNTRKKKRFEPGLTVRLLVVFLGITAVVAVAGAGIYGVTKWLSQTPFFTVNGVTIDGCQRLREDTVIELSGLEPGSNIIALDLTEMARRIERNPWILSASISKKLPDRLTIVIKEREPLALVNAGGLYLVDETGTLFKRLEKGEKFDLPVITGLETRLSPENVAEADENTRDDVPGNGAKDALLRAVEVIKMASHGTRTLGVNDISEIRIEDDDMVLYTIDKGLPLRFSNDESLKEQFVRAEKILYHLYSSGRYKKIAMVDLSYGADTALATMKN